MGYYTRYNISIVGEGAIHDLLHHLNTRTDYKFQIEDGKITTDESIKWYESTSDINHISKLIPDVLILVEGQGENWEDIWREYHKNGTFVRQDAQIKVEFPEFNESDLKVRSFKPYR